MKQVFTRAADVLELARDTIQEMVDEGPSKDEAEALERHSRRWLRFAEEFMAIHHGQDATFTGRELLNADIAQLRGDK